jgi:hypothetical protein
MHTANNALLAEIERIARERDRLEQRERRTRLAIERALITLRERPEELAS